MMNEQLNKLRARNAALQANRTTLEALPIARAEAAQALRRGLEEFRVEGHARMQRAVRDVALGRRTPNELMAATVSPGRRDHPPAAHMGEVLAALLGMPALLKALGPFVDALPEGIATAERARGIAAINAELWDLEIQEEGLIVEAEARGESIARRANADPAALLWMPEPRTERSAT